MRKIATFLILWWLSFGPFGADAFADGGRVVFMDQHGGYRISVFTSPDPLRAGPVDISVLLQDAKTGIPITDGHVNMSITRSRVGGRTIQALATNAAATNKLLTAATVELPEPGSWDVEVECLSDHGPAQARFTIDVGERSAERIGAWPWFSWPAGVVILFGIHRRLVSQRSKPRRGDH